MHNSTVSETSRGQLSHNIISRLTAIMVAILMLFPSYAANPYTSGSSTRKQEQIILRDGSIIDAKVQQITQSSVKFKNETTGVKLDEHPLADVYMIKSGKRGNLFFTQGGKRKTGDDIKFDPKATTIYTTDYREIQAYTLDFDEDKLVYTTSKADRKNPQPLRKVIPQSIVFMVVYSDVSKPAHYEPQAKAESTPEGTPADNDLKVVFNNAKQGDTIASLAERYDVTAAEIREWNELSTKIKDTTPLKPGQQLMLYVKNVN